MCKFCDSIKDMKKHETRKVRISSVGVKGKDTIYEETEALEQEDCFDISFYKFKEGNMNLSVEHNLIVKDSNQNIKLNVDRFAGGIPFKYCFLCGKKLSNESIDFDSYIDNLMILEE
ncbi:hypothetical protein JY816_05775 [Clostridioides difficile]|nr:hypothetical protein [Clostridioides difficile]MCJ0232429.1 hypothetical protein [Clostridioides difficile]MCJ0531521.1 hypothetical protein [Clostridioides difficile]HBF1879712.1 hypothetical protein [Clostridioides difficile]HBG8487755.1 hypothetical protein [Clostridioides difficile]